MNSTSPWSDAIDDITKKVLQGQKILIRALPRSGRTTLLDAVSKRCAEVSGHDPIVVRYGDGQSPDSVVSRATELADATSFVVLLIDDWGAILNRSPEVPWQPKLNNLCVDGPFANVVGVLLTAASGENLSRSLARGSPLVDAVHEVRGLPVPELADIAADLRRQGLDPDFARTLAELYGGHRDLLQAAQYIDPAAQVRRSILQIAASVNHDGAARILDLGRRPGLHLARQARDSFLVPAVYSPATDRTALSPALAQAGLIDLLPGSGDSWPADRGLSVYRFLARLMVGQDAVWFDRYLYSALPELLEFLADVAASAVDGFTLRLLSGPPKRQFGAADCDRARAAFDKFQAKGMVVYWHQIDESDINPLHDRQLLFRSSIDGYHLPPADRIVGKVPPGNENDAYLARAPLGRMESAWERSTCWACVSDHR